MTRSIAPAKWLPRARPYLFLLPMLLFAVGFVYYPFLKTALHSITVVNAQGRMLDFAGLENFRSLFARPIFSTALLNSLRLTALNVPITVALTLSLALLAQKKRRFGASYEILFSLPMALSMSMAALIFKVLLHPTVGYVNYALGLNVGWFTDRGAAMLGILQVTIWMGVGFNFLLFLVALRGMPESLIEAATMDGAGALTRLFRIKLPLLTPTIFYVALTNMVLALMSSGPVMIITQGGPSRATTTLIYLMYTSGYGSSNYSLAACVSLITFAFAFAMTLLAFAFERRGVHYE
ncbi:MAG: sugar ABC transporter permease [Oscillospiraceae bacterium]|jgi:sn-glycerol 3-phosphate transport system permease protein|nr:sugar ABC transporter permease [Oscillospiraceae bacterium]